MHPMRGKVDGQEVRVTHPDKLLWPAFGVTKAHYLTYLVEMAPYLLPVLKGRLLMTWCYPQGAQQEGFARKSRPSFAPKWMPGTKAGDSTRLMANDTATLAWMGNQNALEFHVEANLAGNPYPTYLAFDLDPSLPDAFRAVADIALHVRDVLAGLGLKSVPKTSGKTGLHVYVPIIPRYTYEETRAVSKFIARYIEECMHSQVTLERSVLRRGTRVYFDYLQLWRGKTMAAAYSPRAGRVPAVSTPLLWSEVEKGVNPLDFTLATVKNRVVSVGDLFRTIVSPNDAELESLDDILSFLKQHRKL